MIPYGSRKVPCEFEGCAERIEIDRFDESIWLPVFKLTRQHLGFFCPRHVREVREGLHQSRYLLTWAGADELIIDRKPLPPPG
jgi:hypothetical protein